MIARPQVQSSSRPDVSLRRALFVAAFIVLWMFAIGVRLVHLQVSMHDQLSDRALNQQQGMIETGFERGQLSDREGRQLARSIETESIFVAPDEVKDVAIASQLIADSLGADKATLAKQISEAQVAKKRFLWIARRVPHEQAQKIADCNVDGVHLQKEAKRYYPNGSLAAHVLGFVGLDNNGQAGIEQFYNQKISGEPGKLFLQRDSHGRVYHSFAFESKPGQNIVLTIDQMIQYRAEQALAEAVQSSHAKSGTAIVLDPKSGEILALANAPSFDPNTPGTAKSETRINQALEYVYEPGSTFKIVAFSAALEKGLIKPDDRIDCQMGAITVAKRVIHDHHPFGVLTATEALEKSSNVAAIKLGVKVGDPAMFEYIKLYGFGSRTGVELPGETPGLLRSLNRWQPSSIGSIAIGQEIAVTPLQVAAAFATVANNGVRVAPHLVREIRAANGATVYRPNPEQHRVISPETATALKGMLEGVTLNGTAKKAQLNGYTAAGKTGTAQKIDPKTRTYSATKHVASFVGFAPVSNPAVVIIVVIDEPAGAYHGGDVAAPVFRQIAEQILPDMNVAPDTEIKETLQLIAQVNETPATVTKRRELAQAETQTRMATLPEVKRGDRDGEVVYAAATRNAIVMPDLRGRSVRDVARTCAQLGLQMEARGDGRVLKQAPAPGVEVTNGQTVYFDFGRDQ
ncbi:MAG TPA: penicillin-binding protein [Pyrinomonadaceae bacterium]|nr:penicillin-binding protein [Pyrinomonadaceae bacterium]